MLIQKDVSSTLVPAPFTPGYKRVLRGACPADKSWNKCLKSMDGVGTPDGETIGTPTLSPHDYLRLLEEVLYILHQGVAHLGLFDFPRQQLDRAILDSPGAGLVRCWGGLR